MSEAKPVAPTMTAVASSDTAAGLLADLRQLIEQARQAAAVAVKNTLCREIIAI